MRKCARAPATDGPVQLLKHALGSIGEYDTGDSLEQDPVLLGKFFGASHKDPTRFVDTIRSGPGVDQPHDLILQNRPVAREIIVHDHQVHSQTLHAPISMSLQHLFYQVDAIQITDTYQDDRQITRDAKTPKSRLAELVALPSVSAS